jgi:HSP20 family protein
MTRIVRFSPVSRSLEPRFLEPFFRFPLFHEEAQAATAWNPPVDVVEEKERILVKVEVPGVAEKDLRVMFEDGVLTVSGERQFERREDRSYHRIERSFGSFTRTFTLPRSVDGSRIEASYRDGVLDIEIPKKEESLPKQIQINVNTAQTVNA